MKKKYTKKQIEQSIKYWQNQLKLGNYKKVNESVEIVTDIVDWLEPDYDENGNWVEGMPLEPFLNPDPELKKLLGSLKFKVIRKTRTNGMPEVEISGTKDDVEKFNNWYTGGYEPIADKILDYCEKYMKTHR